MNLAIDCTTAVLDISSPAIQGQWQQTISISSNKSPKGDKRAETTADCPAAHCEGVSEKWWLVMCEGDSIDSVRTRNPHTDTVLQGEVSPHSLNLVDGRIPMSSSLWSLNLCFLIWKSDAPFIYVPCSRVTEINSLWIFLKQLGGKRYQILLQCVPSP